MKFFTQKTTTNNVFFVSLEATHGTWKEEEIKTTKVVLTNIGWVKAGSLSRSRKCVSIVNLRIGHPPPLHSTQGHL